MRHHGDMSVRTLLVPPSVTSRRDFVDRFVQLVAGLFLYGISLALMIRGGIGLSPWDVLAVGTHNHVPMLPFGTVVILTSILVLLLWIPLRQKPGLGTLLNALLVGPAADVGLAFIPAAPNYVLGVVFFVAGLLLLAVATAVYISAAFGPGPRDGLMTGLVRVTGWKIWIVRTLLEGSVLIVGVLLGGPVGLGTVLFVFGVGPLIGWLLPPVQAWRDRRSARMAS